MRQDQTRYRESEWAELDLLVDEACTALADCGPRPSRQAEADREPADPPPVELASDAQAYADISALLAEVNDPRGLIERLLAELPQDDISQENAAEVAPDAPDDPSGESTDA